MATRTAEELVQESATERIRELRRSGELTDSEIVKYIIRSGKRRKGLHAPQFVSGIDKALDEEGFSTERRRRIWDKVVANKSAPPHIRLIFSLSDFAPANSPTQRLRREIQEREDSEVNSAIDQKRENPGEWDKQEES